eukprot:scaffold151086_cov33-Prasinocladus_malaysianus.AAC.1
MMVVALRVDNYPKAMRHTAETKRRMVRRRTSGYNIERWPECGLVERKPLDEWVLLVRGGMGWAHNTSAPAGLYLELSDSSGMGVAPGGQ